MALKAFRAAAQKRTLVYNPPTRDMKVCLFYFIVLSLSFSNLSWGALSPRVVPLPVLARLSALLLPLLVRPLSTLPAVSETFVFGLGVFPKKKI